jgi:two-component system, NarL family, response regulator NreC
MSIKVLLVDDHQIFRDGLKLLIDRQKSMKVVGEAGSGREAILQAEKLQPDIIVMDIGMSDMDGIEATKAICAAQPQAFIIALSIHSENIFVSEMLNAGAKGYLPKNAASDELIVAIKAVVGGKGYLSPLISGDVIEDYVRSLKSKEMRKPTALTLQEKEVMRLIALGCSSKVVAKRMKVKIHTVEAYRKRIMKKLGLGGIADLTKYAIEHRMLDND